MSNYTRPKLWHTLAEGRSLFEFGMSTLGLPILMRAPKGDGHSVLVLPGFLASDASTFTLRRYLKSRRYDASGWGFGRNLGQHVHPAPRLVCKELLEKTLSLYAESRQPISLVGWSLGGILAREIARLMPEQVRQVITLGSPFNAPELAAPMAARFFKLINYKRFGGDFDIPKHLAEPLPVPSLAIYSRSDGIAHWHGCIHHDIDYSHQAENIEVRASHLGYGHHPGTLWLIAKRLSMPVDNWQPISQHDLPKWIYPRQEAS